MEQEKVMQPCDLFRSFDQVCEPDERDVGVFYTTDLENWQQYVSSQLQTESYLPLDLKIQLETIKNLFLYSWFVYRFGVVAKAQTLNVLELALKMKFKEEDIHCPNGLSRRLEKALAEGWFDDGSFKHIDGKSGEKEKSIIITKGMTGTRNSLNHGSTFLFDPLSLIETAKASLDIINALFLPEEKRELAEAI